MNSLVFKSNSYYLNVPTRGLGVLKFVNHRLLVNESNQELIDYIKEELIKKNPSLGIFIDPDEVSIDLSKVNPSIMQQAEYENYLATKAAVNMGDIGDNGLGSNINASSAADVQGKSGATDSARFAPQDILRAKLKAQHAAGTPVDTDAIAKAARGQ